MSSRQSQLQAIRRWWSQNWWLVTCCLILLDAATHGGFLEPKWR
jgi:succinate dehydrogenase hydrophobic anchor subunit